MCSRRWLVLVLGGVVTGLMLVHAAGAQVPTASFTVDQLVARALQDNPELGAMRAEVEAAQGRLRQAGLRPNPMLEVGGQRNVTGSDSNINAGVTLPLDLNGRKEGRVAVAERELDMKRAQVVERERRLRADTRMKAAEVLAARRDLQVTDELLRVNQQGFDLVHQRAGRGAVPPLEERLLLVEVNRLQASRRMLESRTQIATLQLKTLLGWAPEAPLVLDGDLMMAPVPAALDRVEAVRRALEVRPDLSAAKIDVAMARAKILKEQAEGRWDASVNVGYQRQDFGFSGLSGVTASGGTRPIQDIFHYVGAGISITLPVRNRNQGNIAAATADARAAARRVDVTTLAIRQEVEAAFAQYEAARQALDIYDRGVRQVARENLDVVRRTQELGRTTLLDLVAEQRRYIDVEMGYTQSLQAVYGAAVEIERAVGRTNP